MKYLHRILFCALFTLSLATVNAQGKKSLQGAWELKSQKIDGKEQVLAARHIKLVTARHFVWVQQDKKQLEKLLAKQTPHDSIVAYHDMCGAGTYEVRGDTYTETTEFFYDPGNIGTSINWKFKTEGNLWYTSGHYVHYAQGKEDENLLLEEVWKKIE